MSVLFERKSEKTNLDCAKDGCEIKFQTHKEEELCMRYCEQTFNIINIKFSKYCSKMYEINLSIFGIFIKEKCNCICKVAFYLDILFIFFETKV